MATTNLVLNNVNVSANKIVEIRYIKQFLDGEKVVSETLTSELIKAGDDYSQHPELARVVCDAVFGA